MRKLKAARRQWLRIHARRLAARKLRKDETTALPTSAAVGSQKITIFQGGKTKNSRAYSAPMPVLEHLSLAYNFEETASFLMQVRGELGRLRSNYAKAPKSRKHRRASWTRLQSFWDFSLIKKISPDVALLLASEYHVENAYHNMRGKAINFEKWDPTVRAMLDQIGFLNLVGVNTKGSTFVVGTGWRVLRFRSGYDAVGEEVGLLLQELGLANFVDADLYGAIFEAVLNSVQHAYPFEYGREGVVLPRWWLGGYIHEIDRRVWISVYDQGQTIPGSLPQSAQYGLFAKVWKAWTGSEPTLSDKKHDGDAIKIAAEMGTSRTGDSNRGNGLDTIQSALDRCKGGRVSIFSRNGRYERIVGKDPVVASSTNPLQGTLVSWNLQL